MLAVYINKLGEFSHALKLLRRAFKHARELFTKDYLALTFINLSAIYSEMKRHEKALEYANNGIKILNQEIEELSEKERNVVEEKTDRYRNTDGENTIDEEQSEEEKKIIIVKREKLSLLAIAYYNAGSQLEFLKFYKECIESFNQAISVLERNFKEDYPLTLEFKKTLSKAIQKYQVHVSWKGYKRTFSNLNESFVSKKVSGSASRPTSAVSNVKSRTMYFNNKIKNLSRVRPNTAHINQGISKNKLSDSLNNPFGSPDGEEWVFNGDDKRKDMTSDLKLCETEDNRRYTGTMTIQEKQIENIKSSIISPIYEQTKKLKRPQSAKNAFLNVNSNLRK